MRPDRLFALFSDATKLQGVGPGVSKALGRLFHGDEKARTILRDLVFHLPVGVVDRRNTPPLATAKDGDIVTFLVTVEKHQPPPRRGGKQPYKVICHTQDGYLTLTFFHARGDYVRTALPIGSRRVVSGKFERYGAIAQITHPDLIALPEELAKVQALEPVYPLGAGLSSRLLGKLIVAALGNLTALPEWLDDAYRKQQHWADWKTALLAAHHPENPEDISPIMPARSRLAYDEILANQLALALMRSRVRRKIATPLAGAARLREAVMATLPYRLTQGQEQVLAEIDADLASGERMLRLLQGDVGSGKTVVALLAMLRAVEAGRQAALMAPTEILGRQHLAFIRKVTEAAGVSVLFLTGSLKTSERQDALTKIAGGEADIVIGTHALFQEKVFFKDLALAVIDEQHRFGVAQRMALTEKSTETHVLVMTATPIPRTLTMTAFGDMDSSVLAEKPASRLAITTCAVPLSRTEDVLEGVERAVAKGDKVYWICPLVEESDDENLPSDLAAVEAKFIEFKARFGERVAMVHGKMPPSERDRFMLGFAGKDHDILVATTVVEVGVDVPDATIIVIEHAERFGLAQLHQLRGRVGRSDKPSTCILLYSDRCSDVSRSRLRIIRESNDGFFIAEEDLKLRGAGDILGTRQSGLPDFRFADLGLHYDLLRAARDDARLILHQDPLLATARGQALRHLLYLFGYDDNIRYLSAG